MRAYNNLIMYKTLKIDLIKKRQNIIQFNSKFKNTYFKVFFVMDVTRLFQIYYSR